MPKRFALRWRASDNAIVTTSTKISRRTLILPLAVFLVVAGLTAATSIVMVRDASFHQRLHLESDTHQAALRLEDYIVARLQVVDSLHQGWDVADIKDNQSFERRVSGITSRFGGFQAINWIDQEGIIRWLAPTTGNLLAQNRSVYDHPLAAPIIRKAATTLSATITGPIDLFQGGRGFTSYFPVVRDEALVGFLNGVFRIDSLVEECLGRGILDQYWIEIIDNGELVYRSDVPSANVFDQGTSNQIHLLDRDWLFFMVPNSPLQTADHDQLTGWLLALGLSLAVGLATVVRTTLSQHDERLQNEDSRLELERQLQQAQKMEAIGRLAGGVAHDFNNLMTTVLASAEVVSACTCMSCEERGCLEEIVNAAQRSGDLCAKLLTFSRQRTTRPEPLDLENEIRNLLTMLRRLVRENIELKTEHLGEQWQALLDPVELSQIIMNLVVNAADAMPEGGRLEVTTRTETIATGDPARHGSWLILSVTDSGIGMSPEVQDRAFEPFFTTKEVGQGTGLGLATIFGIVTAAGGWVDIESEEGRGTTIEVWLPRAQTSSHNLPRPTPAPEAVPTTTEVQILLVEDDPQVRSSVERVLSRSGFAVLTADNGRQATEIIEREPGIQVVICDLVMPVMGGDELARWIRAQGSQVPIILWSGYTSDSIDREELDRLNITFVTKPVRPKALIEMLNASVQTE